MKKVHSSQYIVHRKNKKDIATHYGLPTMNSFGFTLIETVVAIVIVGVIGVVMSDLLVRSFKGSNKAQLLGNVKQNGQIALNVIDRAIRTASSVVCSSSLPLADPKTPVSGDSLVIQDTNGKYIRFSVIPSVGTTTNGFVVQDDPLKNITGFEPPLPAGVPLECSHANFLATGSKFDAKCAIYLCNTGYSSLPNIANQATLSNAQFLTNYDLTSGVSVQPQTGGSFTRYPPEIPGQKEVINIGFSIKPSVKAGSSYVDQTNTLPFTTTIELR